jgi:hypothetical protein
MLFYIDNTLCFSTQVVIVQKYGSNSVLSHLNEKRATLGLYHRIDTEARFLGFSYDFGVTVIRHQNADAMVLATLLMRGIHPHCQIRFKMAGVQGGNASHKRTG